VGDSAFFCFLRDRWCEDRGPVELDVWMAAKRMHAAPREFIPCFVFDAVLHA
jgi:hypothetical protein